MSLLCSKSCMTVLRSLRHSTSRCIRNRGYCKGEDISGTTIDRNSAKWLEEATIYVHWPFCRKKCTYCNFNKYIREAVDQNRMRECLVQETEYLLHLSGVKKIKSVFFGGGTPSLAEPSTINAVVDVINRTVSLANNAEITLEANPTSTEANKLRDFKEAGINRLSLGVQSLRDEDLRQLGREHSAADALRCLELCKNLFPGKTSVDVIFGRPKQTLEEWQNELQEVLSACDDHLSLYQLTLERGTPLFKQVMDRDVHLPSSDAMADMYQYAVEVMGKHGYQRYEVSNFARREESQSVHNKAYWESCQYLGIGPGAHGRFVPRATDGTQREARVQSLVPETWMDQVEKHGHGTCKTTTQSRLDLLQESMMVALRTNKGLQQETWELFTKVPLYTVFGDAIVIKTLVDGGFLEVTEKHIKATDKGLNVVDGITTELLNILKMHFDNS